VTEIEGVPTPLKIAFAQARATGSDLSSVLPVLIRSPLFVVAQANRDQLDLFITASPIAGRMCVTIAESEAALAKVPAHLVHPITIDRLLRAIIGTWDLMICYPDGGDVLHAEYLPDLRALLDAAT
jgi:hypothetical protein